MKIVVITGSTRGIGYGLAEEFLKRGHAVVVSGRRQAGVDQAVAALVANFDADRITGQPCDVSDESQLHDLWQAAVGRFGRVDIWVNNAGIAHSVGMFWEQALEQTTATIQTNVTGMMMASHIAMNGLLAQGGGQIYNMEGFGSDGKQMRPSMAVYGTSKAALRYFTRALSKEAADTPVQVGTISPGMVITDLVLAQYKDDPAELERVKRIFNIIADRVETVTPFLVERMLANDKNGAQIDWLPRSKVIMRFLTAPFNKRDVFTPEG